MPTSALQKKTTNCMVNDVDMFRHMSTRLDVRELSIAILPNDRGMRRRIERCG